MPFHWTWVFLPLYLQVPAAVAGLEPLTLGLQGVYSSEVLPPLSIAQVFLKTYLKMKSKKD
jgi:hypothetical protein